MARFFIGIFVCLGLLVFFSCMFSFAFFGFAALGVFYVLINIARLFSRMR